jgi:hypothetical protein
MEKRMKGTGELMIKENNGTTRKADKGKSVVRLLRFDVCT